MEQINKYFKQAKWLIPILAIVVIFESVLLMQKADTELRLANKKGISRLLQPAKEEKVKLSFKGAERVTVGQEQEARLVLTTLEDLNLVGADLLIKYNPQAIKIVGTDPTDRFSSLVKNWVEPEKERILVTMVEQNPAKEVVFKAGEEATLLTIKYLPLIDGESSFEIIAQETVGTVLAQVESEKSVSFSAEDLKLKLVK